MPVVFLTSGQKASYGQFSYKPNEVQLARYFYLDEAVYSYDGKLVKFCHMLP
ncbi:MAG: hypothetical protein K0U59_03795 [Gammaproteobacteria bacterium]|nr:hypothetical protein [Gammaproteobacteria bacterium]